MTFKQQDGDTEKTPAISTPNNLTVALSCTISFLIRVSFGETMARKTADGFLTKCFAAWETKTAEPLPGTSREEESL